MDIKRITALLCALCIAATLSACGGGESSTGSTQNTSENGAENTAENTAEAAPVVESIGGLDLSDVTSESAVPADFIFETEAEDGALGGNAGVMKTAFAGEYTGEGFVALPNKDDEVSFEIELPVSGSYDLTMTAAIDSKGISNQILIDGEVLNKFSGDNAEFGEVTLPKILLEEGAHTLTVKAEGGHLYVDRLKLTAAAALDLSAYEVTKELSNPNASDRTKRLYSFLASTYGKYTISGQYSGNNDGKDSREFTEIKKRTGKTPAILGLDVAYLGISTKVDHETGGGDMVLLQATDWYTNENGIVSLCWHWHAPSKYLEAGGQPWWRGFYTDSVSIKLDKIMSGEDKEGYDLIVAEIDNMAEQLKVLADADVPVLWRPLHEAAGDPKYPQNQWFWWGAGGKDAYLELWKLMYDKFTNEHGLNNLIWVWNAQNPEWYPGDEYVDIIGYDVYPSERDSSSQKDYYDLMASCSPTHSKMIAETENGAMFDPDAAFNDGARWAFFSTWNGEFCIKDMQLSDQYTTFEMWDKIYGSERVLTLDEMPDLKSWPLDVDAFLAAQ